MLDNNFIFKTFDLIMDIYNFFYLLIIEFPLIDYFICKFEN
jgi:hypothetical protein